MYQKLQKCRTAAISAISATSDEDLDLALFLSVQDLLRSCGNCGNCGSSTLLQLLIQIIAYLAAVLHFCNFWYRLLRSSFTIQQLLICQSTYLAQLQKREKGRSLGGGLPPQPPPDSSPKPFTTYHEENKYRPQGPLLIYIYIYMYIYIWEYVAVGPTL